MIITFLEVRFLFQLMAYTLERHICTDMLIYIQESRIFKHYLYMI